MSDILSQLWQLQQLDSEILLLSKKEKEIPKREEGLSLALQEMVKKNETEKRELLNLKKKYKEQELDLKGCEEKISQYSVQLYSAKNNEQYWALLREIEIQKKRKSEIEDAMLVTLEAIEDKEKACRRREAELKELEDITKAKIASLRKEAEEIHRLKVEKERERREFSLTIDQNSLLIYERIRAKKDDVAVAEVVDEKCSACFNPIPPQTILEINRRLKLHYCDYCGRILYRPKRSE